MSDRRAVYEYRDDDVPPGTLVLEGPEAVALIAHPVRSKALTHLGSPLSIKELAGALNCPASRLYHHVNKLVDAGLVEAVATRRARSNTERLFRVAARRIEVAGPGPPRNEDAAVEIFERASRRVGEDLARSVVEDQLAVLASVVVALGEAEAVEVAHQLVALVEDVANFRTRRPTTESRAHVIQIAVSRTERSPGSHVVASSVEGIGQERPPAKSRKMAPR